MLNQDIRESDIILKSRNDEIEGLQNYSMNVANEMEVVKEKLVAASIIMNLKYRFSIGHD